MESVPSLFVRSSSCGAEEAGMKGWRERAAEMMLTLFALCLLFGCDP